MRSTTDRLRERGTRPTAPSSYTVGMTSGAEHPWGRVDTDGTVYVRTADGERVIG